MTFLAFNGTVSTTYKEWDTPPAQDMPTPNMWARLITAATTPNMNPDTRPTHKNCTSRLLMVTLLSSLPLLQESLNALLKLRWIHQHVGAFVAAGKRAVERRFAVIQRKQMLQMSREAWI